MTPAPDSAELTELIAKTYVSQGFDPFVGYAWLAPTQPLDQGRHLPPEPDLTEKGTR